MPKLKKSRREEFLANIGENIHICVKLRGAEKVSMAMGITVSTVYSRINNPSGIKIDELYILAEYMGAELEDLIRPLKLWRHDEKE